MTWQHIDLLHSSRNGYLDIKIRICHQQFVEKKTTVRQYLNQYRSVLEYSILT